MIDVLIFSNSSDPDSKAVKTALLRRGVNVEIVCTEELHSQLRFSFFQKEAFEYEMLIEENEILLSSATTVWWRRPKAPKAASFLHHDDVEFCSNECILFLKSICEILQDCCWVNPILDATRADCKMIQLRVASEIGFLVPPTIITNNRGALEQFVRDNSDREIIYKPFQIHEWRGSRPRSRAYSYAVKILPDAISSAAMLAATPGIYQIYVEKKYEIRVSVFGSRYHAIRLDSEGRTDWRNGDIPSLKPQSILLDKKIALHCIQYLKQFRLKMGCFDFVVDKHDNIFFLEMNEQGQFLFWDEFCPEAGILESFCDFLLDPKS